MPTAESPLTKLIERAGSLYSLPAVAMEVVRLTSGGTASGDPVDTRTLKDTIEGDPALTAKILRVVNSSLFGLSGEVGNLTQAIALLGVQPLKLLVLGFSLPDRLFADLAGEALQRYWTASLTRAVVARSIATDWFTVRESGVVVSGPVVSGDDAFVAGLLRDLGSLVLIQELGEPYLQFLEKTDGVDEDRLSLERDSLGFDRLELTASLLHEWKLPPPLIAAVARSGNFSESHETQEQEPLAEVLRLAELLTQLVAEHRIAALPELLERGAVSCGLTKAMVNENVATLQAQVDSLADAMQAPLVENRDYSQVLFDAHAQMSVVSESAVGMQGARSASDDELSEDLLAETHELRLAMRSFLSGGVAGQRTRTEGPHAQSRQSSATELNAAARRRVEAAVDKLAANCRLEHVDLSLAMIVVGDWWLDQLERREESRVERAVNDAESDAVTAGRAVRLTLGGPLMAVLLPGVDRREAIAFCQGFASRLEPVDPEKDRAAPVVHAGLASVAAVPNRFAAATLVDGALRCLSSAQAAAVSAVKSIEVY